MTTSEPQIKTSRGAKKSGGAKPSEHHQMSKFAAIFAGGTMVSRVTGLVRDAIMARVISLDAKEAFLTGFRFPNMLRDLVGEGAMNAAFVPVFSETAEKESDEAFREFVSAAMSLMLIVLIILSVLGVVFSRVLLSGVNALKFLTNNELSPEQVDLMVSVAGWVFPYIFFIGMTVFMMGPLFTKRHYLTPSWSPALLNIAMILACYLFRGWFASDAYALVAGVWLGGISQLIVQYIALGKYTGVWKPNFHIWHPGIRTVFILMGPVIIGQATGEVNKMVDAIFAASLGQGTQTAFYFANRLVQLPLSIFGMAIAVAALPILSRSAARNELGDVRRTLIRGLRQSYFLIFPSMVGLIFFGEPIILLLFGRNTNFTADVGVRTNVSLAYYSAGLLSFAWVKVLLNGFYAVKDTKTPVIVASASMFLNIVLAVVLVRPFGYRGLALATTISYTVNCIVLYGILNKQFGVLWNAEFFTALLRMTAASVVMVAVLLAARWGIDSSVSGGGIITQSLRVFVPITAGGTAYLGLCWLLGVEELQSLKSVLRRR